MADHTVRFSVAQRISHPSVRKGAITLLSGPQAGTLFTFDAGEIVVGRTADATLVIDDAGLSRRHARFFCVDGQYFVADLKSTNGTFVAGIAITTPTRLDEGDRIQLGTSTVLRFTMRDDAELEAARRSYEKTVRDALTGAHNRHFLDERLAAEVSFANRHRTPLTVMFVDADHFKKVNDTYGHAAGDEVLRRVARLLCDSMRTEDVVARYGGEEFVVLLRGVPTTGALAVAERVRAGVEALKIGYGGRWIPVTVSIGVATMSAERPVESTEALLALADGALYRAKGAGRNRVVLG
jgi:diguanylate cyclase (GGDEF)-like protein